MQTRNRTKIALTCALAALISIFSASAQAGTFLIDLSDEGGSAAGWDVFTADTTDSAITDQNSLDNDVTLSIAGIFGGSNVPGVAGGTPVDSTSVPSEAWDDYVWGGVSPPNVILFEFKNLDPGAYNVSVFEGRQTDDGQSGTIWAGAIGDDPGSENTGDFAGSSSTLSGITIGLGDSLFYSYLEDETGGTSGIIVRSTPPASGVPEPSTLLLAVLACVGLTARRRLRPRA